MRPSLGWKASSFSAMCVSFDACGRMWARVPSTQDGGVNIERRHRDMGDLATSSQMSVPILGCADNDLGGACRQFFYLALPDRFSGACLPLIELDVRELGTSLIRRQCAAAAGDLSYRRKYCLSE